MMWLGELITDRGIGNGMSIRMFIAIAAGFPGTLWAIKVSGNLADARASSSLSSRSGWRWFPCSSSNRPSAVSRSNTRTG